jgi:hypothetical protein
MKKKVSAAILLVTIVSVILVSLVAQTLNNTAATQSANLKSMSNKSLPTLTTRYYIKTSTEAQYNSSGLPESYLTRWVVTIQVGSKYPTTLNLWNFHMDYNTIGEYGNHNEEKQVWNGSSSVAAWNLNYLVSGSEGQPEWQSYQNVTIEADKTFQYTLRFVSGNQTCSDSITSSIFRYVGTEKLTLIRSMDPL